MKFMFNENFVAPELVSTSLIIWNWKFIVPCTK